jgi:hypothetical protein
MPVTGGLHDDIVQGAFSFDRQCAPRPHVFIVDCSSSLKCRKPLDTYCVASLVSC